MENFELIWDYESTKASFDGLGIGVHIIDGQGVTILYNRACAEMDGMDESQVLGKNMRELVNEGIFSKSLGLEALDKRERVSDSQVVNGRIIFTTSEPVWKEDGTIRFVLTSCMDVSRMERTQKELDHIKRANEFLLRELSIQASKELDKNIIISHSKIMEELKILARRIAVVDTTILLEGESGVGKGLLGEYIHHNSLRKDGPFIKINCATFPENLIESELFGYAPGAFTGASKQGKPGLIELSNKGTLFLDEIAELPLGLQAKLLNVLQDKVISKIGSNEFTKVDTRIIAATNQNLKSLVKEGKFRLDLYYRLNVIMIEIPPLRQRKDEIIPLATVFLDKINQKYDLNRQMSPSAMKELLAYDWPGNVRELENEIERAVVTCEGNMITANDVRKNLYEEEAKININRAQSYKENVALFETVLMKEYIKKSADLKDMSQTTGLDTSTIRKKAKRLNIELTF